MSATMQDRFRGSLLGLACGDALGLLTEFRSLELILESFGMNGIQELPEPALFTDDTQMTIAVAEALCSSGHGSIEELAHTMSAAFVLWMDSPENNRAAGHTCMSSCNRLKRGVPWQAAGDRGSKGCGANMRVAPIGLYACGDEARLRRLAVQSALLTHAHPAALAAAEATALCVAWAVQGIHPGEYLDRLEAAADEIDWHPSMGRPWGPVDPREVLSAGWQELLLALRRVPHASSDRSSDYCSALGQAWVADEALACALYCACSFPDDYLGAVRRGANSNGDSDSIACIAGAMIGARLGEAAIPLDWRRRIEKGSELVALADRLHAAAFPGE
jgi:ADP-ribosylglycohydrolase